MARSAAGRVVASPLRVTCVQLLAVVCDGHGPLGEEAARVSGEAVIAHLRASPLADRPLADFSPAEAEALLKVRRAALGGLPAACKRPPLTCCVSQAAFSAGHDAALAIYENPPSGDYLYPTGCSWEKTYSLRQGADGEGLVWVDAASSAHRVFEFGSTCTVALLDGQALCVANVGDSLAVLARGAGGDLAGKLVCVEHNCRDAGECERVEEEAGAAVEACRATGYLRVAEGKHRVRRPGARGCVAAKQRCGALALQHSTIQHCCLRLPQA